MTDIQNLFDRLDILSYPDTMKGVKGEIRGRAFFPGGKGTCDNRESLSNTRIMVLGQDFDSEKNYNLSVKNGQEDINKNPTWRNLCAFLTAIEKSPKDCFFTNAIMGVRKCDVATGKSPSFKDKKFIQDCQKFFLYQIEIQKPEVIFVLGKYVAEFLAFTFEGFALTSMDLSSWKNIKNFATIDEKGNQIKKNIIFNNGIKTNLVLLTHPSYRPANIHRRSFNNYVGHEAEIKMAQEIFKT